MTSCEPMYSRSGPTCRSSGVIRRPPAMVLNASGHTASSSSSRIALATAAIYRLAFAHGGRGVEDHHLDLGALGEVVRMLRVARGKPIEVRVSRSAAAVPPTLRMFD